MRKYLPLSLAALLVTMCWEALPAEPGYSPSLEEIASLEKAIRLPMGARPLGQYRRFYAGKQAHNGRMIVAVLVLDATKPGIDVVDPTRLPVVFDGGCSVIDIEYDVESHMFKRVTCHGDA
jgi:hypothetical protein